MPNAGGDEASDTVRLTGNPSCQVRTAVGDSHFFLFAAIAHVAHEGGSEGGAFILT